MYLILSSDLNIIYNILYICIAFYIQIQDAPRVHPEYDSINFNKWWKLSKTLKYLERIETLPKSCKAYKFIVAVNSSITTIFVIGFLIHPIVVKTVFSLFQCKTMSNYDTSQKYLIEAMNVQCWSNDHLYWTIFAGIPMLIFYVIGMFIYTDL